MATAHLKAFSASGYEILDDEIDKGRVTIWSRAAVTPRLGDLLLIESHGYAYDVEIVELTQLRGGWAAEAEVVDLY
ncbi:hypothetical protein [Phenylobacterium soli]|uniref:Uncharacterized protein n=1 Tax=Phenylobacterium soli TaxID=2170551 RepID=A0A328AQP1_9CAUL|nr:hypothetical protein [Phenylobacterium soli]RAK55238.1 hypothetical protein DJ017_12275 [Phenylobacterium soli]